jgi:hypothetical protein
MKQKLPYNILGQMFFKTNNLGFHHFINPYDYNFIFQINLSCFYYNLIPSKDILESRFKQIVI